MNHPVILVTRYLRLHHKLPPHRQLQAQRLLQVPREGGHRAGRARQRGVLRGAQLVSWNSLCRPRLDGQRGRGGGEEGAGAGDRGQLEGNCLLLLMLRAVLFLVLFYELLFGYSLHAGGAVAEFRGFQGSTLSGWPVSQTTVN